MNQVLEYACVKDLWTDGDAAVLEAEKKRNQARKADKEVYRESFELHFVAAGGNKGMKSAKKKLKKVEWEGELTKEWAASFLPPGAALSKDLPNRRWLGVLGGERGARAFTISRSFPLYGEQGSLRRVLQGLWLRHERCGGKACPWDFAPEG